MRGLPLGVFPAPGIMATPGAHEVVILALGTAKMAVPVFFSHLGVGEEWSNLAGDAFRLDGNNFAKTQTQ